MASLLFISSKHTSRGICLLSQFAQRSLQPSARLHLKGGQLLLCSRCFNASNGSRKLAAISRRSFEGVKYFRTSSIFLNSVFIERNKATSGSFTTGSAGQYNEEQVVNVPPFAESVSEGDIRWEKDVGDEVATDEVVCEIETDKTSVPVPSPGNGVILERYVDDGASVKAGQKLFKINITGTAPSKAAAPKAEAPAAPPPPKVEAAAPPPPPPPPPSSQAAAPATPPPPPPPPAAKPIPVAAIRHAQCSVDDTVTRWKVGELFQSPPEVHTFHVEKESDTKTQTLRLHLPEDIRAVIKLMEDHPEVPLSELGCRVWPEYKEHTNSNLLYTRILKALRLKFAIDYVDKPKEFWHQTVWCSRKVFHYDGLQRRWRSRGWHRLTVAKVDPENFGGKYDDVIDVTMGFWVSIWAGGTVSIVPSVNFVAADYIKVLKNAIEAATVKVPPVDYSKEISGTRSEQRVKMNRMRLRIAQRLKDAQNTNAMLTTFNELDMSAIMDFRKTHLEAFTKKYGIKLGFMSAFVKAAAYALQDQPVVNAVIDENEIVYRDYVDISVAVATPKGLVVPVIRNVESMNYADIELTINALGEKARKGALAIEDMDGGTFTISNGGVFGSLFGTPIINPPQSAILGMHGTFERPVAIKGQVVVKPMMYIALTYDHRLIDGREAVLFLRKVKAAVEDPRIILAGL